MEAGKDVEKYEGEILSIEPGAVGKEKKQTFFCQIPEELKRESSWEWSH